jgi:hypothetical protein
MGSHPYRFDAALDDLSAGGVIHAVSDDAASTAMQIARLRMRSLADCSGSIRMMPLVNL